MKLWRLKYYSKKGDELSAYIYANTDKEARKLLSTRKIEIVKEISLTPHT